MCGIAVTYFKKNSKFKPVEPVAKMLDVMHYRGYDQTVVNQYDNCVVGFRRLAITDIETAQPQGDKWKVYLNGEIYNYKELGFSGNECSVIAQGLEKYGEDFVNKLNGMFFILAINGDDVFVFRDRYGIKPVYYFENENVIVIASEAKAIAAHPEYQFAVEWSARLQWYVFNNVFTDVTLFKNILKLDKGTWWQVNLNHKVKYWEWNFRPDNSISFGVAAARVKRLISQAIARQIPSEVDYACCLSGGIDSNIIAQHLPASTSTFTACFDGADDERALAKLARPDNSELIFKEVCYFEETISHLDDLRVGASWANYGLYKLISDCGKKVCFDGAGADELFGGYTWRYEADDYYSVLDRTKTSNIDCKHVFKSVFPDDTLEKRFEFDANHFLEGVLLVVDKLSMAHSLEMRLPFLDNDLVDYCLTLPNEFKVNKKLLKYIYQYDLPTEIITGKKKGFSSPDWIEGKGNQAMKWADAAYQQWEKTFNK